MARTARTLAPGLVANVILPRQRVGSRAGHDDFHHAFVIVFVMPGRAQLLDRLVKLHADAAAHADHHRLAFHRGVTRFPMLHQIFGHERDAFVRPDHCFQLRPLPPQTFLGGFLRVFRHFFKVRVNLRTLLRFQINLRQPRLVISRHGRLVFLRLQDVVNVNDHGARQRERIKDVLDSGAPSFNLLQPWNSHLPTNR